MLEKQLEHLTSKVNNLDLSHELAAGGLKALVHHSGEHADVSQSIHASSHTIHGAPWLHNLLPGIEKFASQYHVGNFVVVRGSKEQIFEAMPIYARLGMHLLFYGHEQVKLLHSERVEHLLKEQSIKEGKLYDDPESVKSIPSFVETYSLSTEELLEPDITKYKTFNEFFSRKLKPDARPVDHADDPLAICSAADCRLTVYQTVDLAKEFWIKGREFTIPNLLGIPPTHEKAQLFDGSSLAIFRLAPSDYHRFHSPIDAEIGEIVDIPGQYYTVNPQAVNEPGFDVFTANKRSVLFMTHTATNLPVAFVAIGALLVASIGWTNGGEKGKTVKKGEELGYFAYGGSTVVAMFPRGVIEFDADLVGNSVVPVETLMKVGNSLGRTPTKV
ncbi:phosphatidylserine decarboxylase-domain-containing protein [Roridomyces roridus]|uniref:phosphatidylserine decarboxylase n=1 Tax=Roridomyces roridus TaxID=1738132 RepID=A0AAD7FJU6_9AGAR|nr:phosphatidylserine decarboxylase-domain-containing protein [Roridomyces roridus]